MYNPDMQDAPEPEQQLAEYPDFQWVIKHAPKGFIQGDEFHLVPENDHAPHLLSPTCDCTPKFIGLRDAGGGEWFPLFSHYSYDLREVDEWWFFNISHPELK